jgi:mono/diheme cytochrome c family protein
MKFKLVSILILAAVALQFIPYGKDHANPPVVGEPQWDSPRTKELFFRVCASCHSNTTTWPWYSSVAPVSWLIQYDVDEGREHFNVSMWGVQKTNKGHDAAEEVGSGEMPPWVYVLGHPEAKLSESERAEFVQGLTATFGREKGR